MMDTSPKYINMCRQAKELQKIWEPTQGDFFELYGEIETIGDYSEDLHPIDYREEFPISKKNCVWLPRIDQLISNWTNPYDAIESMLHGWPVEYDETESLEINGIKRVMKLKYNKSWNGEDWIE